MTKTKTVEEHLQAAEVFQAATSVPLKHVIAAIRQQQADIAHDYDDYTRREFGRNGYKPKTETDETGER